MKTMVAIFSSFLLFIFAGISFPRAVYAHGYNQTPVTDVSGNEVLAGEEYYIYSPPFVGITTDSSIDVVLSEAKNALPIIMSPQVPSGHNIVRLNTDLSFKFNFSDGPHLGISPIWEVGLSALPRQRVVRIGGDENYDFRIGKYDDNNDNWYKLLYCPKQIDCSDVGYVLVLERFYLIPGGQSFPIVFRRVNEPNVKPYISSVV